jgi:thiosulfate reductase cytochrome b subunit
MHKQIHTGQGFTILKTLLIWLTIKLFNLVQSFQYKMECNGAKKEEKRKKAMDAIDL